MQLGIGFEPRGAAQGLPERSGVGQLQRAARARRRQGPARRVAGTWRGATCGCTRRSPARAPAMLDAPGGGAAGRARQGDRRRRRARPRRAHLRRRRQHLHRLRQRHRRDWRRPRARRRRRRGDGADAEVPPHLRAGHHLRADGAPGRGAQRAHAGRLRQEDDLRQQRRRGGRERGQAGAQVHRAAGGGLLRGRLPRPHAAHAEPDQQVRAVQERLRARSRPRSCGCRCRSSIARRPA